MAVPEKVDQLPEYLAPRTLDDAVSSLVGGGRTILAGGTDFYPQRVGRPVTEPVVDISQIAEMRGIEISAAETRIGALTTWTDIIRADLPSAFDGLKAAAREVGGVQIQNLGTIAGNLCNASPAADGVPPLLTLDAAVELRSAIGPRTLALDQFITGYRKTALGPGEIMTAVVVPASATEGTSSFLKLGSRTYLVISIVMVAARLESDGFGKIASARLAVGACSEVAQRLETLEHEMVGKPISDDLATLVQPEHLEMLDPIDDARATAQYRLDAALTLVRRAVTATSKGL